MKHCGTIAIFTILCAAPLCAGTVSLTTDPFDGSIAGMPGETVGWGFTLTWNSDAEWMSVTSSALTFETNPSLGTYTDFVGLQGGPLPNYALAPSTSWAEVFDAVTMQGLASYQIALDAVPFAYDSGSLVVFFDTFDGNPLDGGLQTGSSSVAAPFAVAVAATTVPEPSYVVLGCICILASALLRRR